MTAAEMNEEATPEEKAWEPPFAADPIENLECPECGEGDVCVKVEASYDDGTVCAAYCSICHSSLEVYVHVEVDFSSPYATDETPLAGSGRRRLKEKVEAASRATTWRVRVLLVTAMASIFGCCAIGDLSLTTGVMVGLRIVLAMLALMSIGGAAVLANEKARST